MRDIWREQAIEELTLYPAKKEALRTIPERIRELESAFGSLGSPATDKISVRGGTPGDKALNNIVQRDSLTKALRDAEAFVDRVERGLNVLMPMEREMLQRFYITPERGAAERIAQERGRDKATIYRQKDDALYKFKTAMFG